MITLAFDDVDALSLQRLSGAMDAHLAQLARVLNGHIRRRLNGFEIEAEHPEPFVAAISQLLELARSRELTDEDIHLAAISAKTAAAPARHPESTAGIEAAAPHADKHAPRLRTRRGSLGGRTPRQNGYIRALLSHDIVFGLGPAGTGKTYLAVAAAVDAIERHVVERIVLVRPAVEAGEKLGFLPGDLAQKVDPYLRPLYDALYDLMGFDRVAKLLEKGLIEIAPLAYMRGRTLNNAFVILDEAQNTTPEQMKMFLTRIGFGARAVITGDLSQIDLPRQIKSGLRDAREKLQNIDGIYFHVFTSEDVVRHPLVQKIVDAYEAAEADSAPHPAP